MGNIVLITVGVGCWILGAWLAWKSLTPKPKRTGQDATPATPHPGDAGINFLLIAAAIAMMIGLTCFRAARSPGPASEPATGATLAPDR